MRDAGGARRAGRSGAPRPGDGAIRRTAPRVGRSGVVVVLVLVGLLVRLGVLVELPRRSTSSDRPGDRAGGRPRAPLGGRGLQGRALPLVRAALRADRGSGFFMS